MSRALGLLLASIQTALGVGVAWRLWRTGGEAPIRAVADRAIEPGAIGVVVPVLNEAHRLAPCLDGLLAHGIEVGEIVIVDGGSTDATRDLVRAYASRDQRVRLVEAGPAPDDWNGKVWGLGVGERALSTGAQWLLTLDADVRPSPALARSLVARAERRQLRLLSVATAQRLSGLIEGVLHPALLATLVYRFGRPGGATSTSSGALANGQCCLIRRDLLDELGGFQTLRDSLCEDVTLARLAARGGDAVGFYESDDLIEVAMYADWREAWHNWPRSLATRDRLFGVAGWRGLAEVLLVQALPLPLLLTRWPTGAPQRLNLLLLAARLGMLIGMARAYPCRPWTYWLSPVLDLPAALALWRSALRRRHVWRGRVYARRKGLLVAV
ncbi:MAG TPA: glycosyltransferase family 2 protein [Burkholderiaceae bacterium]